MSGITENESLLQKLLAHADEKRMQQQEPVFGVTSLCDLPYFTENGTVRLLDVYLPQNAVGKLPIIVDVHGGAWYCGSKETNRYYGMYLASQGFAVINADYQPAQYDDLRNQVSDLFCVFRWVRENADGYGLDRSNMFLCGNSVGAHLALLSYIVNLSDTLRAIYRLSFVDFSVRALGIITPVTDLHFFTDSMLPIAKNLAARLLGDHPKQSPYYYCASIADVLRSSIPLPPVYLLSSEDDFFSAQSLRFDHLLTRRNVPHTFRYCAKGTMHALSHSFPVLYPEYTESVSVNREMLDFFRRNMKDSE